MGNLNTNIINALNKANFISIALVILFLPMFINLGMRIALVLMILTYLIEFFVTKKWQNFTMKNNKSIIFFSVSILYFLIQFLYLPFEQNTFMFSKIAEERLAFLIIGIIGLFGINNKINLKKIAWLYIGTSVLFCVFLLLHINKEMITGGNFTMLFGQVRVDYINSHMKFNFFLNVTLAFIYYLLDDVRAKKAFWKKLVLFVSAFVVLVNLWLSDGRIGAVTSLILIVMILIHYLWSYNKIATIVGLTIIGLSFSFFIFINPRFTVEKLKTEPRLQIWKIASGELSEAGILGEGASTASININNRLLENGLENKHPHNLILQCLIEYGVLGLAIILSLFITPYWAITKRYRFILSLVLISGFIQLMFGVFMRDMEPLSFLLPLLFIVQQDKNEKILEPNAAIITK